MRPKHEAGVQYVRQADVLVTRILRWVMRAWVMRAP